MAVASLVHVQVGQFGIGLGEQLWETVSNEHNIGLQGRMEVSLVEHCKSYETQLRCLPNVMFDHITRLDRYVPLSVMVDSESGRLDSLRSSAIGRLFSPDSFIYGQSGTGGNNFAKMYYSEGPELLFRALDAVRRETERIDSIGAIQFVNSIGGGTGSGLGSLLLESMGDEYPGEVVVSSALFPSIIPSDSVVELYNALLSLPRLIEHTMGVMVFDNLALGKICKAECGSQTLRCMNTLCARAMSGFTSSMRFPGLQNCSIRKLCVNLTPFPRPHFFILGLAPLRARWLSQYTTATFNSITREIFHQPNILCSVDPLWGRFFSSACLFRGGRLGLGSLGGGASPSASSRWSSAPMYMPWIPDGLFTAAVSDPTAPLSATMVGNTTAMGGTLHRIVEAATVMLRRRAFVHYFEAEGLEEMEFVEALSVVRDLIDEYQLYESIGTDTDVGGGELVDEDEELVYTPYPSRPLAGGRASGNQHQHPLISPPRLPPLPELQESEEVIDEEEKRQGVDEDVLRVRQAYSGVKHRTHQKAGGYTRVVG